METTDIVIHKGEKEERYQLYVEDYVMSYLKNYGVKEGKNIFFYGRKERGDKKYYIYGAGRQPQISNFAKYDLLEEITCRLVMDMPVFSVKEDSENYELAGYYIFYQSNEAMQSYMIERRKEVEAAGKEEPSTKRQSNGRLQKIRPQEIGLQNFRTQITKPQNVKSQNSESQKEAEKKKIIQPQEKASGKTGNRLMTVQLSAIFIILAAIVINSTNSYTKLSDLNQAAVEVFFAMENQEAAEGENYAASDNSEDGITLHLTELDEKFAQENKEAKEETAKQEDDEMEDVMKEEAENAAKEAAEEAEKDSNIDTQNKNTKEENKNTEENNENAEENNENAEEVMNVEETSPSKQAFARNFAEYYKIEKGDTLYTISQKIYGDTSKVKEICELNQIENPDDIKYGQKILLP